MSQTVTATIAPTTSTDDLRALRRNPVVTVIDDRDGDIAKNFKTHRARVDQIASTMDSGALFTLVQRASSGFWISEWTVVGHGDSRHGARRRATLAATLDAAVADFGDKVSRHSSHWFRPEEGLTGWYRRL